VRRGLLESPHPRISVRRQCELLGISRSSAYYETVPVSDEDLRLQRMIDGKYTETPFYGVRRMTTWLRRDMGEGINPKRVRRLMREMCLEAIYPKPRLLISPLYKLHSAPQRMSGPARADA
jgi:putative transposase